MIRFFVFLLFLTIVFPIHAENIINLDYFDFGTFPAATESFMLSNAGDSSEMENCLLDQSNCTNSEYRSSAVFSLEDVVNLGVIKREQLPLAGSGDNTIALTTEPLPSIDMEILFDFNSDTLRSDQYPKLIELAQVLSGDKFRSFRIVFLGHSDAKGEQLYNQMLSRRRAKAVSDFISGVGGLPSDRLIVNGLGSQKLKDPSDPFGAQNRRVQVLLLPGS